jgi:tellurite resistance protein
MSTRADYTVEEWEAIRRTPPEAVVAVEQASPSGFLGRRRERKATEQGFAEAIAQFAGLELVDAIVAAREEEGRLVDALRAGAAPMADTAVASARAARRAVDAKGTREEAEAFANAVIMTCERVARASGERGEDTTVSRAEAIVLQRLGDALGLAGYEPPSLEWRGQAPLREDL